MKSDDKSEKGAQGASNDSMGKNGSMPQTDQAKSYRDILEEVGEGVPSLQTKTFGKRGSKS